MKSVQLVVSCLFLATLAGAVGIVALNSRAQELSLVPVAATSNPTGKATNLPASIAWEPDFESAMQKARTQNKPILIDFYTDWCGWCKEMDKSVYPDAAVVSEAKKWVMVKINGDKRRDVAQAYGVRSFPTVIFAHKSGKPIDQIPGFAPAAEFADLMRGAYSRWTPTPST